MKSKKFIVGLLTVAIISSVYVTYGNRYLNKAFAENINQNKVYTVKSSNGIAKNVINKVATGTNSKVNKNINYDQLKTNALDTLKIYFGTTPETSKYASTMKYHMNVVDTDELLEKEQTTIDEIKKSPVDKHNTESIKTNLETMIRNKYSKLRNMSGSGYIVFSWGTVTSNGTKNGGFDWYSVIYNKSTAEIEGAIFSTDLINYPHPQTVSVDQDKSIAENFITTQKIAGIKSPKFVRSDNDGPYVTDFFYEDANDSSKKAHIIISPDTNKVNGFYENSLSDPQVQRAFEF